MNLFDQYRQGLSYADFLARHGTEEHRARWRRCFEQVTLTAEQRQILAAFTRTMPVLCLAGAWCGDCVNQCPIFEHFAAAAPVIQVRISTATNMLMSSASCKLTAATVSLWWCSSARTASRQPASASGA